MNTNSREWLATAQTRANNATRGPWGHGQTLNKFGGVESNNVTTGLYDIAYTVAGNIPPGVEREAQKMLDAGFISTVRTDAPAAYAALIAVLDIPAELDDPAGDPEAQAFANGHNAALALVHRAIDIQLGRQ